MSTDVQNQSQFFRCLGPFTASLSGKTARHLSTSMVEAGKGGAKDPLELEKRNLKPEKTQVTGNIKVSTPKATTRFLHSLE